MAPALLLNPPMRKTLPILLLTTSSCFTTIASTDLPLEAFDLAVTVTETRGGRIRVDASLGHCGVALERIELKGDDRLEASLDGKTIDLTPGWFSLGGSYSGIFPWGTDSGEVTVTLLRTAGGRARPGATVQLPAEVRIVSPRKREPVSRGSENLEVRWTPMRGEDAGSTGSDQAFWEVLGTEACSSEELVPDFNGVLELGRADDGFDLQAGTLALPALSGSESCKSELVVVRTNIGAVDTGFCSTSSIRAERGSDRIFKSTP